MAKKNRKRKKQYSVVSRISPVLIILVLAAGLSLTYLWLCEQCETLGTEIQQLETHYQELHRRLQDEESDWSYMQSLPGVRKALEAFDIEMNLPEKHRIVLVHPLNLRADAPRDSVHQYAQVSGNRL